jgi:hypothetical protein
VNEKPPWFGEEAYGEGKQFFDEVAIDNLYEAFLELTAEVWVHRDRAIFLEAVVSEMLTRDGLSLSERIENYRPTAELEARRKAEREAFAHTVYRSFTRHLANHGGEKS